MVNYSKSATALLFVCQLAGTAAYGNWDTKEVKTDTIVDKKCEEIIAGSPPLCTRVCDVVTTTMMGDEVIDEYSKVTKGKCLGSTTYGSKATSSTTSYGSKATSSTTSYGSKAVGSSSYGSKAVDSTSYGSKAVGSTTNGGKGGKLNGSSTSTTEMKPASSGGWGAVPATTVETYGSKAVGSTSYGSKAVGSTSYGSKAVDSTSYGSKAVGTTSYGSKAVGSTTYGGKGGKPNGSSTSTTEMKPASSGGWGAVPAPTPAEIIETPSPTTCMEQEFYYSGGICTNEGFTPGGVTSYSSLLECCEDSQAAGECEFVDICCEMRLWYFSSESGECTNGFLQDGEFASLQECCEATQSDEEECLYDDVCVEDPPTPSPTPEPTPVPTPVEIIVTPSPTTPIEIETTGEPTFGSTPTVSKEVTGPPTEGRN